MGREHTASEGAAARRPLRSGAADVKAGVDRIVTEGTLAGVGRGGCLGDCAAGKVGKGL